MNVKVTRAGFENLVDDLIERAIQPCKNCIRDAGLWVTGVAYFFVRSGFVGRVRFALPELRE